MYLAIKDVKPIGNYKLILIFADNSIKLFDMKPYLVKGVFKELKDENLFKTVKVSFDSIEWSNGIDIDPETLYEDSVPYLQSTILFIVGKSGIDISNREFKDDLIMKSVCDLVSNRRYVSKVIMGKLDIKKDGRLFRKV